MEVARLLLLIGVVSALKSDPALPQHGAPFTISRTPLFGNPKAMTPLEITDHVVTLKRGNSKSLSSIYVQTMRQHGMSAMDGDSRLSVCPHDNPAYKAQLKKFRSRMEQLHLSLSKLAKSSSLPLQLEARISMW